MALKMRKDIKKSSYYVWFLGAQESKGLRGSEYVLPVVKSLIQRERNVEPFKVTLQVSHKGLKIIQNVPHNPQAPKSKKPEVVKHFIPHHAVTCVLQDVDIVSCILLLYNPVTKCPVHVHAYRCDSVETAEILKGQLQTLIERPDNQKKLGEIETRLRAKGLLPPANNRAPAARRLNSGGGSDGRSTSTRESESSGGSSSERLSGIGNQERITNLYDSLAAELREKLGRGVAKRPSDAPILLPPRDYDTVHRQKGNLTAIDLRRCLNTNIVGVNVKKEAAVGKKGAVGSSGGSSGIGSDHAPSPDQVDPDQRYLDNQSTSDEEWTEQPSEDSLFLVQPGAGWPRADLSLPRARRLPSNDPPPTPSPPTQPEPLRRRPAEIRQRTPSPPPNARPNKPSLYPLRSKAAANNTTISKLSPRDRFKDAKEKFLLLERERIEETEKVVLLKTCEQQTKKRGSLPLHEMPISPVCTSPPRVLGSKGGWSRGRDSEDEFEDRVIAPPAKSYPLPLDYEDDVFEQHGYPRNNNNNNNLRRENKAYDAKAATPARGGGKARGDRDDVMRHHAVERRMEQYGGSPDDARVKPRGGGYDSPRLAGAAGAGDKPNDRRRYPEEYSPERKPSRRPVEYSPEAKPRRNGEYSPDRKPRRPEYSPERKPRRSSEDFSPERQQPRRSLDFSPERQPLERVNRNPRPTPRQQQRTDDMVESRYRVGGRPSLEDVVEPVGRYRSSDPLPSPRHFANRCSSPEREEDVVTSPEAQRRHGIQRAQQGFHVQEKKRRSMFDVMEEERKRSSNELAKEFKRRSYQDGGSEISGDHSRSSNLDSKDYCSAIDSRGDSYESRERERRGNQNMDPRERISRGAEPRDLRGSSVDSRDLRTNQNNVDPRGGRDFDPRGAERRGGHGSYQELNDTERFPGLDRETARHIGHKNLQQVVADARYRHSYAEPGLGHHLSLGQSHHEMLHRTNSTISSGRVGIAAIHPY